VASKLRVLHIYRTYFPETQGGGQESIRQVCLATQAFDVENTIFALAHHPKPAAMIRPEGKLFRARSWFEIASCDFGGLSALRLCREIADQNDIIQIHYPWPFADMILPFIRKRNQPVVVTYVSDIVRQKGLGQLYAPLRRYLLGTAKRIVASSPNYVESSEILREYRNKLVCIPHCLEESTLPNKSLEAEWADKFGRDFFLFIGVLRYYKGLDFLLAAASKIETDILIVGEGPEGLRLRRLSQKMGLTNVHFLGALQDVDKLALLSLCRAVVFPSHLRSEAFGITLLEGARASKPLISCEIGSGTSWVNRHNETGLVIPPADHAALANALSILEADDALCHKLGEGARKRWLSNFSPKVVGSTYRKLYDEILGTRYSPKSLA
jgi:rhamnosyl/mannosyltransferase